MKYFALLFLFLCSCNFQNKTCENNDLTALNLKGHIKSVVVKNYLADERNGQFIKGPKASQLYKLFNQNGNLLKSVGGYTNEVERVYSDEGLLEEEIDYWDKKVVRRYKFSYDNLEREKEVRIYGQTGSLEQKRMIAYLENSITETKIFDGNNQLLSRSISHSDEFGREVRKEYFNSENQSEVTLTYMYDEEGRKILDQSMSTNEKENSLYRFVYNEEGLAIQNTIKTWYQDTIIEYDYVKFDDHGNWIVRHSKEKKEQGNQARLIPRSYEEREIAYY